MSKENDEHPDQPDDKDKKEEEPQAEGAPGDPPRTAPAPTRETDALIHHPDVVAAIKKVLKGRGVRRQDLDDGVGAVQTAVLGWAKMHPTTVAGWKAVCCATAANLGTDDLRKATNRAKDDAGLTDEADEHGQPMRHGAFDPVDMGRVLDELRALQAAGNLPPDTAEILDAAQAGVPHTDVAAEMGVPVQRLRYQYMTIRERLFDRLRARGLGELVKKLDARQVGTVVTVAVVLLLFWIRPRPVENLARFFWPAPAVDAGAPPAPSAPPPSVLVQKDQTDAKDEKAEKVDALFAKAQEELKNEKWDDCFATMDQIARLDPTTTERMRPIYKACGDGVTGILAKSGRDGGRAVKKRDAGRPAVRDAGTTGGDSGR